MASSSGAPKDVVACFNASLNQTEGKTDSNKRKVRCLEQIWQAWDLDLCENGPITDLFYEHGEPANGEIDEGTLRQLVTIGYTTKGAAERNEVYAELRELWKNKKKRYNFELNVRGMKMKLTHQDLRKWRKLREGNINAATSKAATNKGPSRKRATSDDDLIQWQKLREDISKLDPHKRSSRKRAATVIDIDSDHDDDVPVATTKRPRSSNTVSSASLKDQDGAVA